MHALVVAVAVPQIVHAPHALPAAGENVAPAEQPLQVLVPPLSTMLSKPALHTHTRFETAVQSSTCSAPAPHAEHALHCPPAAEAKVLPAAHGAHVRIPDPEIPPCPDRHAQLRSLVGLHCATCCVPLPQTVHAPHAPPATPTNVLPATHAAQVLLPPPVMLSCPALQRQVLSWVAEQAAASSAPVLHTVQAVHSAVPATGLNRPVAHCPHWFTHCPTSLSHDTGASGLASAYPASHTQCCTEASSVACAGQSTATAATGSEAVATDTPAVVKAAAELSSACTALSKLLAT